MTAAILYMTMSTNPAPGLLRGASPASAGGASGLLLYMPAAVYACCYI